MKKRNIAGIICWLTCALCMAGCMTPRVDWNTRVGTFTYDQAVLELGPPDKQTKLTNSQTVAEWISHYSTGGTMGVGTGIYGGGIGGGYVIQTAPTYHESHLRLIFDTNNVLAAWSRN